MNLLIFSDIHRDWEALQRVLAKDADCYICLGDYTQSGSGAQKAAEMFATKGKRLWLIHGNSETPGQVAMFSEKWGGTNLHQQVIEKEGYHFAGMGGSNLTPFNTPGDVPENQLRDWLDEFQGIKNLLLFTHVPPHNTKLDQIDEHVHVGSKAVREFIDHQQPLYHFSGHVHENAGKKEELGKTKCHLVGKQGFQLELPVNEK